MHQSLNYIPDKSEVLADKSEDRVEPRASCCNLLTFRGALTATEMAWFEWDWPEIGISLQYLIRWKNLFKASRIFFCRMAKINGLVNDFRITKMYPTEHITNRVWGEKSSGWYRHPSLQTSKWLTTAGSHPHVHVNCKKKQQNK